MRWRRYKYQRQRPLDPRLLMSRMTEGEGGGCASSFKWWPRAWAIVRQCIRQFVQQGFRILPTDAGIGDRDPVFQWFVYFPGLLAWFQIAFQQKS